MTTISLGFCSLLVLIILMTLSCDCSATDLPLMYSTWSPSSTGGLHLAAWWVGRGVERGMKGRGRGEERKEECEGGKEVGRGKRKGGKEEEEKRGGGDREKGTGENPSIFRGHTFNV